MSNSVMWFAIVITYGIDIFLLLEIAFTPVAYEVTINVFR